MINEEYKKHFKISNLQRDILISVIIYGPINSFKLSKMLKKHYESVWRSIKKLSEKGLLTIYNLKNSASKRDIKLCEITGMGLQGFLNIDLECAWYLNNWIYTIKEFKDGNIIYALHYHVDKDKITRVIIPTGEGNNKLAKEVALSLDNFS